MKKSNSKQYEGKMTKRAAGILLPVSSIPSNYGIGTFGKEAYLFVDKLKEAGQIYWQVLPMGPTSYGDSPYQSFSAFAGNPYFIDLDMLIEEGLLTEKEVLEYSWGEQEDSVDYAEIFYHRFPVLEKAFKRSKFRNEEEYKRFLVQTSYWLEDYSLYMALKCHFNHVSWQEWDEDIRNRDEEALSYYKKELEEDMDFWRFCQYKFYEQWNNLKSYANENGIYIIGDIPLYVAMDSADVWANGRLFEMDERKQPIHVAGVPPDAFSADGQRWGNPVYDWDVMEQENFTWWRERMKCNADLYDIIRIDHFIGVVRYYKIPASCPTAKEGKWTKGPGSKLTDAIKESIGNSEIIAEDLGVVVPSVRRLMKKTGWPGMHVLEFAFDGDASNDNLPHNFKTANTIVYAGTHDNETLWGFIQDRKKKDCEYMYDYFDVTTKKALQKELFKALYATVANTAIAQMADVLVLDNHARINTPSTLGCNWKWRMKKQEFTDEHVKMLRNLAKIYGR